MIKRGIKPHLIISSPYQRALETAWPTKEHYKLNDLPYDITTGRLSREGSQGLYSSQRVREFSYLNDRKYEGTSRDERTKDKRDYWEKRDSDYINEIEKNQGTYAESFNQACRDVYLFVGILMEIESEMQKAGLLSNGNELTVLVFSHEQRMDIVRLLATYPEAMQHFEKCRKNGAAPVLSKEMGDKLMKEFYRIAIDLPSDGKEPEKKAESRIPNGHIMETRISSVDASIELLNKADKIPPPIAVQAIDAQPVDPFSQSPPATPSVPWQSRKGKSGHGPKR